MISFLEGAKAWLKSWTLNTRGKGAIDHIESDNKNMKLVPSSVSGPTPTETAARRRRRALRPPRRRKREREREERQRETLHHGGAGRGRCPARTGGVEKRLPRAAAARPLGSGLSSGPVSRARDKVEESTGMNARRAGTRGPTGRWREIAADH